MIGSRMKKLRKNVKLSQTAMARNLRVRPSAISQMETGKIKPSVDTLILLSEKFDVNLHWMITGEGSMYEIAGDAEGSTERRLEKIRSFINQEMTTLVKAREDNPEERVIELAVRGEIPAGKPLASADTRLDWIAVRKGMLAGVPGDYIALRVNGRSMEPDIHHNDVVVIRKNTDWRKLEGQVCAVRIDGEITLKRLTLDDSKKMVVLLSLNEAYQPILVDPSAHQDLSLLGSLHMLQRKL